MTGAANSQVETPLTDEIVMGGACIGCGLCAAISDRHVSMGFTPEMRERPIVNAASDREFDASIKSCCPGKHVEGLTHQEAGSSAKVSQIWGYWHQACIGWAADPKIRHMASSGGVLSALATFLLKSSEVDFILHLGPDPDHPARSRWKISDTPDMAADTGGSRYGPAAPLVGLYEAKRRVNGGKQRFAFIGKPCDISAIRLLAKREPWLANSLTYRLSIMCGGQSEFSKTSDLLTSWGVQEDELSEFRYRGFGNPGPTRATTNDGRTFETSYQALWEDEGSWALQHRCKICPDAIGMAADLVAFDCWPGGGPTGEDDGFNAILTRTPAGDALLRKAMVAGAISTGRNLDEPDFENFQPHQSRKRKAVWARLVGQRVSGNCAPTTKNLNIRRAAMETGWRQNLTQARGTRDRLKDGLGTEPRPRLSEQ